MYEWVEARRLVGLFPPEPVAIAPPLPPASPLPSRRRDEREEEEQPRRRRKKRRKPWNWLVIGVAVVALCALVPVFAVVGVYFLSEQQIGQRIGCNGGELYYTPRAPKAEAERLCDYLVTCGFFNGDLKSVQIDKKGRWYQVRRNPPLRRPLQHA